MKRYETYKDSGIEWLGEIPEHWRVAKLKNICILITDGSHFSPQTIHDGGLPYITVSNVYSDSIHVEEALRISNDDFNLLVKNGCQPESGDVLLSKDGTVGRSAIVEENNYVVLSSLGILRPGNLLISKYFKYSLDSSSLQEQMKLAMAGSALRRITIEKIKLLLLTLPSVEEQKIIVSYLDYTIGKVNSLISAKEKQVEDLQQYRSSIISEAVTRGLHPDVEYKDSGIEWIGQIPKHWDVNFLKRVSDVFTGSTPSTSRSHYWDNATKNWYTPSDFSDDIHLHESDRKVSEKAYLDNACRVFPKETVFIVGIGATLGKVGIASSECSANQQINAVVFNKKVDSKYGAYYLYSKKEYMNAVANTATLPILNQSATKELAIVVPPLPEQQEIADFLDAKTSKIDATIQQLKTQIEDLRQYKKSVISEAVTGKVDLRDWKPK